MHRKVGFVALFILVALTLGRSQQEIRPAPEQLALNKAKHGVDGWLRIATDDRLTSDLKKQMWGVGDWSFVLEMDDPRAKVFTANPPQNASLQVVDRQGRVIGSDQLERPLAKIGQARIDSSDSIFLVTVDYSIGFGPYAGPTTSLVGVRDGKIVWLKAIDADSRKEEPILLPKTLKFDWKFLPLEGKRDILQVSCHPDFAGGDDAFLIDYVRYRFNNGEWIKYVRTVKGFWESDEGFPALSKFRK
jgi:hypothetical protein